MIDDDRRTVRRIAFLTPEFLTEAHASGGIGNYVAKMSMALAAQGVSVEVFVPSTVDGEVSYKGIRVHRVRSVRSWAARGLAKLLGVFVGSRGRVVLHLLNARALAAAVERRHREAPFDAVQSANHHLTGFCLRAVPGRVHAIRISTSRRLYDHGGGPLHRAMAGLIERLDVAAMRRADVAYAPSAFLAGHFSDRYGLRVEVLRPPAELGGAPAEEVPFDLPPKYLVHFGSLGPRKGTDAVARALIEAWESEPDLRMVWAGPLDDRDLRAFRTSWGAQSDRVDVLGLLEKDVLYRVIAGATAAVLPSTVDNLPNTVIESLALGVPVIGSDGASIDELVEHESSGLLVAIGDEATLARAMIVAWRERATWLGDGFVPPAILLDMRSDRAVASLLSLLANVAVRA